MSNTELSRENSAPRAPAPRNSAKARAMGTAARRHVIPFAVWIGLMFAVDIFNLGPGDGSADDHSLGLVSLAWAYAWRVALGVAALFVWRPWRYYDPPKLRNLLWAALLGVGVFLLWIGLESEFIRQTIPALADSYERWGVMPFGKLRPEPALPPPYAPEFCGWGLTLIRLGGSAFVIALIEEFFWRGFLYRWIQSLDFLDISPARFDLRAFMIVAGIFAAAHNEWLAALATGLLYCWFFIRTRDIWATAIAHSVTNLLLGVYVLITGYYHFW